MKRFLGISLQNLGPKTTYFRQLCNSMATLRANISGQEHDIDNRETALSITKGPQNFRNFGPLTAKNRTAVFIHPPKSSCAWRRRPSCWPALRRANSCECNTSSCPGSVKSDFTTIGWCLKLRGRQILFYFKFIDTTELRRTFGIQFGVDGGCSLDKCRKQQNVDTTASVM